MNDQESTGMTWARVEAAAPYQWTAHEGHMVKRTIFEGSENLLCHTCRVSEWYTPADVARGEVTPEVMQRVKQLREEQESSGRDVTLEAILLRHLRPSGSDDSR